MVDYRRVRRSETPGSAGTTDELGRASSRQGQLLNQERHINRGDILKALIINRAVLVG